MSTILSPVLIKTFIAAKVAFENFMEYKGVVSTFTLTFLACFRLSNLPFFLFEALFRLD